MPTASIVLTGSVPPLPGESPLPFFDFSFWDWPELVSQNSTQIVLNTAETGAVTTLNGSGLFVGEDIFLGTITGWEARDSLGNLVATVSGLNWSAASFDQGLVGVLEDGDPSAMLQLLSQQDILVDATGTNATQFFGLGDDDAFITSNITYFGGWVSDNVDGSNGNDSLSGNNGFDSITGGLGNDTLDGGAGEDTLRGNDGADLIEGGDGNDRLWGGGDNDTINGAADNDIIGGGAGQDLLNGGTGNDSIYGGGDNDTLNGNDGVNALWGMAGADVINASDNGDRIGGGGGADTINGGAGNDTVYGGIFLGETTIYGNGGNDEIYGSIDNDTIFGGTGNDNIGGNLGDDRIDAGTGADTVRGFDGADTFVFEDGQETLLVEDFDFAENDILELETLLWGGGLTASEVLDTYGSVVNGNTVLDFGGGDVITLAGITDLDTLATRLNIVSPVGSAFDMV